MMLCQVQWFPLTSLEASTACHLEAAQLYEVQLHAMKSSKFMLMEGELSCRDRQRQRNRDQNHQGSKHLSKKKSILKVKAQSPANTT